MTGGLRRTLSLMTPYWRRVAVASVTGFATVAFGIGLMSSAAWLVARAALRPGIAVLQVAIVGVRFFGLGRGVLRYAERLTSHDVALRLLSSLRVAVYRAFVRVVPGGLAGARSGDLLARAVDDVGTLEQAYVGLVGPCVTAVLTAILVAVLLHGSGVAMQSIAIAGLAVGGLAVPVIAWRAGRGAGADSVRLRAELHAGAVDAVQGASDLLALGRWQDCARRLAATGSALAASQVRSVAASALGGALVGLAADLGVVALLLVAAPMIAAHAIEPWHIAVIVLLVLSAFEAVVPLPAACQALDAIRASATRLFDVADMPEAVARPPVPLPTPRTGEVTVDGLRFTYPGSARPALDGVTFRLAPGRLVAVVGPSGSGKTTIVRLLLRHWEIATGQVLLGGVDVTACDPDEVRARMAVVSQRTHLFTGTIRDNLLLARPTATREALDDAIGRAGMGDLIASLPDGCGTWIGEQGLHLSGGERQKLALARAILQDAPILLLDEPTAHLDPLAERHALAGIRCLARARSTLLITHRPAGLEMADEIVVLANGRVVQRGTFDVLARADGWFRRMLRLQRAEGAIDGRLV